VLRLLPAIVWLGCGPTPDEPCADAGWEVLRDFGAETLLPSVPTPPSLTPCLEGWVEVPGDDAETPATCRPWPAGDPADPPVQGPCPEGWVAVPDGDLPSVCRPWPGGDPEVCAADAAHFPDASICRRLGTPCPDGGFPEGLPEDVPVLYVRAGDPPGGAGTIDRPFGGIAEAVATAAPGTIVALHRGTYAEEVRLPAGVTLWGACVADTLVASPAPSDAEATIEIAAAETAIRNLRIGGERMGVRAAGADAAVEIRDVLVEGTRMRGILAADGARVDADGVVVRGTRPSAGDGRYGRGLQAMGGATAALTHAVFEGNAETAIAAFDAGTTIDLRSAAVTDGRGGFGATALYADGGAVIGLVASDVRCAGDPAIESFDPRTRIELYDVVLGPSPDARAAGRGGRGVLASEGATFEASRTRFEGFRGVAVAASGRGTSVELHDVLIRDTEADGGSGEHGYAIAAAGGARVGARRMALVRPRDVALIAAGAGTEVELTDVRIRDVRGASVDGSGGHALLATGAARIRVVRGVFERCRTAAVGANDPGTTVELNALIVRDTLGRESDGMGGRGVEARGGALVEVWAGLFDRNREVAAAALGSGTVLRLQDVVIRDTAEQEADGALGRALVAQAGARVEASRVLVERNREIAVFASGDGTVLDLSDAVVRDGLPRAADGRYGRGIDLQAGARLDATRLLVQDNPEGGIAAWGIGTRAVLFDLRVRRHRPAEASGLFGSGVVSLGGAAVEIERFAITDNAQCGVQLAHGLDPELGVPSGVGGTIDLHDGEVARNVVCGANVRTEGFTLSRLQDHVRWRDNGTDLDTTELPIPPAGLAGID
jgi:hypothetical protein